MVYDMNGRNHVVVWNSFMRNNNIEPPMKLVYICLEGYIVEGRNPSIEELSESIGYMNFIIEKCLKVLEEIGAIKIVKTENPKINYYILADINSYTGEFEPIKS